MGSLTNIIMVLILFLSGVVTDLLWALYILKIAERKRLPAALYSVAIGACSLFWLESMLYSVWIMPAWLLGLFIGTYFSEKIEKTIMKTIRRICDLRAI